MEDINLKSTQIYLLNSLIFVSIGQKGNKFDNQRCDLLLTTNNQKT